MEEGLKVSILGAPETKRREGSLLCQLGQCWPHGAFRKDRMEDHEASRW